MRRLFPFFFTGLLLSAARAASAEGPPRAVRLAYQPAEGCPAEDVFRDMTTTRLKRDPFDASAALRLLVTLRKEAGRYAGIASLLDESGALRWSFPLGPVADCHTLIEGLSLAVAVRLREMPAAPPAMPPRGRLFGYDGDPKPAGEAAPLPAALPAPIRLRLGASAGLAFGSAPGPVALGGAVEVGFGWKALSVSLQVRADAPSGTEVEAGGRVSVGRYTGALVPCGHWKILFGCAVVELGALHVTSNAERPDRAFAFWAGIGGRVGLEIPLGAAPVALRFAGDLEGVASRAQVRIDGETRWTSFPVAGGAWLGVIFSP